METINISYAGPGQELQQISPNDKKLITSNLINSQFGEANDYLELHIYDEIGRLLLSDYDGSDYYPQLVNPKDGLYSSLILEPEKDLRLRGYNRGNLNIQYNFYKKLFGSEFGTSYWIKEISTSRTELKVASQKIPGTSIEAEFLNYQSYIGNKNYYPIFYLNFGENRTCIATNVALTRDVEENYYLLIKLYEPLPAEFDLKSEFWIVDKISEPVSYNVNVTVQTEEVDQQNKLRGPNYSVQVNNKTGQTTPYYNYSNLINSPISESFQKLISYYQDKSVDINVDYSNFSNFVHFSSAVQRINNFVSKLQTIETSYATIAAQQSVTGGSTNLDITNKTVVYEKRVIDDTIKNFDIYEYFLYFNSSSWAWPKSTATQPYQLYSVTSSEASNFLGGVGVIPTATTQSILWSASYYDSTNKDLFHNTIPQYLLDDPSNEPYITFLDMIGQHFDNIWVYYKDVSNRFNATNNPDTGISLDLVSDALKGLGFQLFTNTNVSDNLYYTLFGVNRGGSLLPPTGSELITNYVTSSIQTLPSETIQDEIYKRLYHNLPYLYKTKGTVQSIRSLINIFGIPESILKVREFGGNYTGSLDGIFDLNTSNLKVSIISGSDGSITGSSTISSSLLSPYTTIQYYQGDNRVNVNTIEVAFSPADVINDNIISTKEDSVSVLGDQLEDPITTQDDLMIQVTLEGINTFNINELIGLPAYRYESYYTPLVSASNAYFASYTQPNSIWEYIRLLKFYNNSLFKIIKNFVPARSNVSTGLVIKSHMYERNKYPRHEPSFAFNDYSQSIDILNVSAGSGGAISGSTAWSGFVISISGSVPYASSQNQELFTGQFNGSNIVVTDGLALQQGDYISTITGSVEVYNYGALYQNVSSSVRSQNLVDLDYTSNQLIPVNYGIVTESLNALNTNAYSTYTNPTNPFAQVQDYNYNLKRSLIPRYEGSQISSQTYNTYTEGDQSYGKTATIDKIKYQYGYIVNIDATTFQMPYRAKGQIKYIIDNNENVLNLSKTNTNWFETQNIFKSGESADVSLFSYEAPVSFFAATIKNPYIERLNNEDNDFTIWESGYTYTPVIYNPSGSLVYDFEFPVLETVAATSTTYTTLSSGDDDYWTISTGYLPPVVSITSFTGYKIINLLLTGSAVNTPNISSSLITYYISNPGRNPTTYPKSGYATTTIPPTGGTAYSASIFLTTVNTSLPGDYSDWQNSDPMILNVVSQQRVNPGTPATTAYTSSVTEVAADWYLIDSNKIKISPSQSRWYGTIFSSGSYTGLDAFVFPLSFEYLDIVRLYNSDTNNWDQAGEFRVISVDTNYSDATGSAVALTLDRDVDTVFTADPSATSYPIPIYTYMGLKRLKDETSIYFNYNLPLKISSEGTLFPEYIGKGIKEASGDVIKSLKQQNLI